MAGRRTAPVIVLLTIFVTLLSLPVRGFGGEDPSGPPGPDAASPEAAFPDPAPAAPSSPEPDGDVVLDPGDVASRVEESDDDAGLPDDFFVTAIAEIEKGNEGLHAGLLDRIAKNVHYFQNRGRDRFEVWLARSGKYANLMRGILQEYGLPEDLIYLALIESGFSPKAYSVARAAGPWQFISGTARRYGLKVDWWVDERRDYEKSTHAAASYLRDLYGMFDSWPLATAAYNAGEGKIQRAVSRYKTDDFATLIRYRYLKHETKDYVPKMLAALSIAKEPEKYGFADIRYEEPLEFERVVVSGATDLVAADRVLGLEEGTLKDLNPELRRFCTPPTAATYEMRVPKGIGPLALERADDLRTEARVTFLLHSVGKKESLASISAKYGTPVEILKEINGLKKGVVKPGMRLIVPVTGFSPEEVAPGQLVSASKLTMAHMRVEERRVRRGRAGGRTVLVRRGDTLSGIAKELGVSRANLAATNGIDPEARVKAGTRLRVPGSAASRPPKKAPAGPSASAGTRPGV